MQPKTRIFLLGVILGTTFGLVVGIGGTAHAATDLERCAERIARALERIAHVAEHNGSTP